MSGGVGVGVERDAQQGIPRCRARKGNGTSASTLESHPGRARHGVCGSQGAAEMQRSGF